MLENGLERTVIIVRRGRRRRARTPSAFVCTSTRMPFGRRIHEILLGKKLSYNEHRGQDIGFSDDHRLLPLNSLLFPRKFSEFFSTVLIPCYFAYSNNFQIAVFLR